MACVQDHVTCVQDNWNRELNWMNTILNQTCKFFQKTLTLAFEFSLLSMMYSHVGTPFLVADHICRSVKKIGTQVALY